MLGCLLCASFWLVVAAAIALFVKLLFSDGDLTLMFCERFGKPVESLAGKVVWITGASSGIGRALALKLASVRCRLVLTARRVDELLKLKDECLGFGLSDNDVLVLPLDLTNTSLHKESVEKVLKHFKEVDILVNNAGRSQRAIFEKIDIQVDRDLFELNVFSQISLTTELLPHFLERKRGHVVFMSSIAGKTGVPGSRSYTGSKHALHGYAECLRTEKGNSNIDVTLLCPGPVFSEILKAACTGTPGEAFNQDFRQGDKRMTAERCSHLSAVAIANKLDEAWISLEPILLTFYASQYLPTCTRWVMKKVGTNAVMKMRDGRQTIKE